MKGPLRWSPISLDASSFQLKSFNAKYHGHFMPWPQLNHTDAYIRYHLSLNLFHLKFY